MPQRIPDPRIDRSAVAEVLQCWQLVHATSYQEMIKPKRNPAEAGYYYRRWAVISESIELIGSLSGCQILCINGRKEPATK